LLTERSTRAAATLAVVDQQVNRAYGAEAVRAAKTTRLPPDERREQLLALGLELLGRSSHEQVSIGELARAAGISKGLLYHYFPTKSDFVVAVLRHARDDLDARMAPDPSLPPQARLDQSLDAFLRYAEEHAAGFIAVARARAGEDEAIRAVLLEARRRRIDRMVDFAAALSGAPRAELESPALEAVIEGWLAFCEGVVVRWLAERTLEREAVLVLVRRALLSALASVAAVDPRPAYARLAEAAGSAGGATAGGASLAGAGTRPETNT
jgi:AcrR family transcriptional regulator